MDQLVDAVIEAKGARRYLASISHFTNRRIELISHALEIPPKQVADERRRLGVLPPDELRRMVDDLGSYLVGVALGRWDVRLGRNPGLAALPEDPMGPIRVINYSHKGTTCAQEQGGQDKVFPLTSSR